MQPIRHGLPIFWQPKPEIRGEDTFPPEKIEYTNNYGKRRQFKSIRGKRQTDLHTGATPAMWLLML